MWLKYWFNQERVNDINLAQIESIIVCPGCKGTLVSREASLACSYCGELFPVEYGVPIFVKREASNIQTIEKSKLPKALYEWLYSKIPRATCCTDDTMFRFINDLPEQSLILNLGSGMGLFDDKIKKPMINLDILKSERTHVVADGHCLPFKDSCFDCVFSNAVLEHVKRPWIVASEIERVIKPDGYVVVNLPFLNTIHDKEDYFRFTLKGIKELFPGFKEVNGGVSGGGGSFLPLCTVQYLNLFVPTKLLRSVVYFIWGQLFFRLKWLDFLVRNNPDYSRTANSFYFIGVKNKI